MSKKESKKNLDEELILQLYKLAYHQYKINEFQEALKTFNEIIAELELVNDKSIFVNKFLVSSKTAKALIEAKLGNWEESKKELLRLSKVYPKHIKILDFYDQIVKGEVWDINGLNISGFDKFGLHYKTRQKYDLKGFDIKGFNIRGYDKNGYNREGFDKDGYDHKGFNKDGFNKKSNHFVTGNNFDEFGFDFEGYDKEGFNVFGFNKDGFDSQGFDSKGYNKLGYDRKGFDKRKFNIKGINKYTQSEYDREGYNIQGYDREGFNKKGFNKEKIHKYTKTKYDAFGRTFDNKEKVKSKSILDKEYEENSRDL